MKRSLAITLFMLLTLALAACAAPAPQPAALSIRIDEPPSHTEVAVGQSVVIESTADDATGITRVELLVDDQVVKVSDAPGPQKSFNVVQPWTAAGPGEHRISVRAINTANVTSAPAAIVIVVAGAPAPTRAATQVIMASPTITATAIITATKAPTTTAVITPTKVLTATVTAVPPTVAPSPTACVPVIASFTADRIKINRGESTLLRWGKVSNADQIEIDNGIGPVGSPSNHSVAPHQTTTYTLRAHCGKTVKTAQVTITVVQPAPTAVPRHNISGHWAAGKHSMQLTEAMGCRGLVCNVTGDYTLWTGGTPEIAKVSGTVNVIVGGVSLKISAEMPGAPVRTFTGTLSSDSKRLTGTLSGVGQVTFVRQ